MKRERKERKERENTLPLPTLLRALNQMDVASRACTFTLAIGATHVNILSASISKIQNFIFSIQACLKVISHVRTHVRGVIVVLLMKIIMDNSACKESERAMSLSLYRSGISDNQVYILVFNLPYILPSLVALIISITISLKILNSSFLSCD